MPLPPKITTSFVLSLSSPMHAVTPSRTGQKEAADASDARSGGNSISLSAPFFPSPPGGKKEYIISPTIYKKHLPSQAA